MKEFTQKLFDNQERLLLKLDAKKEEIEVLKYRVQELQEKGEESSAQDLLVIESNYRI